MLLPLANRVSLTHLIWVKHTEIVVVSDTLLLLCGWCVTPCCCEWPPVVVVSDPLLLLCVTPCCCCCVGGVWPPVVVSDPMLLWVTPCCCCVWPPVVVVSDPLLLLWVTPRCCCVGGVWPPVVVSDPMLLLWVTPCCCCCCCCSEGGPSEGGVGRCGDHSHTGLHCWVCGWPQGEWPVFIQLCFERNVNLPSVQCQKCPIQRYLSTNLISSKQLRCPKRQRHFWRSTDDELQSRKTRNVSMQTHVKITQDS